MYPKFRAHTRRLFSLASLALALSGACGRLAADTKPAGDHVPAKMQSDALEPYPKAMESRKIPGKVSFICNVDATGQVSGLHILAATYEDFIPPALAAIRQRKFTPATDAGKPVASRYRGAITFAELPDERKAILASNQITGSDGQPPSNPPRLYEVEDPVFPTNRLLAGESGQAIAVFVVQADGRVGEVQIRSATKPEYGEALRAALETWLFEPAMKDGQRVSVTLSKRTNFKAVPKKLTVTDDTTRVIAEAREDKISTATGLDQPLTPIYQLAPNYPASIPAAEKKKGDVLLSMVICQDGRVRLPQVLKASDPAFGWAALTAVNQWIFEPPMRKGMPVDIRVQLPVMFGGPAAK
jgi:TonB family protein